MTKVITIYTHGKVVPDTKIPYVAMEYPELNKYLEDGYSIKEIIHQHNDSFAFSLTFILRKRNSQI